MRRLAVALLMLTCACSLPRVLRDTDDPTIDDQALSTRLDRADLERALEQWYAAFMDSDFVRGGEAGERTLSVLTIENGTSEHISSALDSLILSIETRLVNDGEFAVIGNDRIVQEAILDQHRRSDLIDPESMATIGKQLGVSYFVSGVVGDTTEKTSEARRVQYYLFLKVTEVETLRLVFQSQIDITKQITG